VERPVKGAFCLVNPITIFVQALRGLLVGGPVATPLMQSLAWITAIVLVFGPLAVRRYRKVA
jgi:oleandomycin transport system permease protein